MDDDKGKISVYQLSLIIILMIGLMNHVMVIPILLDKAGRGAWLSVLFTIPPLLLWLLILVYIIRKTKQQNIIKWLKQNYGAWVAWSFMIPIFIVLLLIGSFTLKDTVTWLNASNLPETPNFILAIGLMLLCVIAAKSGIRSIAISSGVILPFVMLFGFFVASANIKHKDYKNLLPIFEHGIKPELSGMIYVAGGLVEIIVIIFMQHHLKVGIKLWKLLLLSFILVALTLGPTLGAIAEFGPFVSQIQRYPAFEQWRLLQIGRYLEHVDFLAMYQWLSGAFIRISAALFIILDFLNMKKEWSKFVALFMLAALMVGLNVLPISDMQMLSILTDYYFPIVVCLVIGLSFILFALVLFSKLKGGTST